MDRSNHTLTYNLAARRPGLGVLGIPVALAFAAGGVAAPQFLDEPNDLIIRGLCLLLAATAFVVGILVLAVRQGVRIDRRQRRVYTWNCFAFARRERAVPLDEFGAVELRRFVTHRRNGPPHVFFHVNLIGGRETVVVWTEDDQSRARAAAEELSAFAGLPLQNRADMPVYQEDGSRVEARRPEALDMAVGDVALDAGDVSAFPDTPADCRVRLQRDGDAYRFELPPVRRSLVMPFVVAILAVGAAGAIGAWVNQQLEPNDPLAARLVILALPAALGLALPPFVLGRGFNRRRQEECLTITPLALHGEVRQCWTHSADEVPLEMVEEFGFTPMAAAFANSARGRLQSPALIARTDHKTLYLGRGLSRAEQVWLHEALRYLMAQAAYARRRR